MPAADLGHLVKLVPEQADELLADELLAEVRIEARGKALRWRELDEDLTVEGILAGRWRP